MVAILSDKKEFIFEAVQNMYTDVACHPDKVFHFPTGRQACLFVGYPAAELDAIPATAVESFAGVGYPFGAAVMHTGHHVLDIGSGSGTDVLISALKVGPQGRVVGLDMTQAMLDKLRANIGQMGVSYVQAIEGNAEAIPLPDQSIDIVTSNGVLNLVPDKLCAFTEILRVLKPGGAIQIADIVLNQPISEKSRQNPQLWAECIVGAALEMDYLNLFKSAGFTGIEVLTRFDYFAGSTSAATRQAAQSFGAQSIVLRGRKPH